MAPETRQFSSTIALACGPLLMLFGWLFLEAGTGLWLLGLGIVAMAAGIALRPTRGRALAAIVGFAAGCSPVIFLVLWFTGISG